MADFKNYTRPPFLIKVLELMMVIAAAGAILYITAGALNLEFHNKYVKDDKVLAAGILGLVNGVVHLADVFLSWRG
ncbi:Protein of unknown function [Gryllus bimaculatus]|nr:Protein of unknown function [Gryllus bimaculatus]